MAEELTTEQRLSALEREFADLKRQIAVKQAEQETLDQALLARIDSFLASQARQERSQLTIFQQTMAAHKEHDRDLGALKRNDESIAEVLANHKQALEELLAGQAQIIALLKGEQKRND